MWERNADRLAATRVVARVSHWLAWGLIGLGLIEAFSGLLLPGLWLVLIGWFLDNAGRAEATMAAEQGALGAVRADQLMASPPVTVPQALTVEALVHDYVLSRRHSAFPVIDAAGAPTGLVALEDVRRLPPERRAVVTVRRDRQVRCRRCRSCTPTISASPCSNGCGPPARAWPWSSTTTAGWWGSSPTPTSSGRWTWARCCRRPRPHRRARPVDCPPAGPISATGPTRPPPRPETLPPRLGRVSHWRRLGGAMIALTLVVVLGTVGYLLLGFSLLDAAYQTVTTVSTVGFREVRPLTPAGEIFTMVLILVGVGATLYAFSVLIETLLEGRLNDLLGRRRMEQSIAAMSDHVVICGWGRVGRAIAGEVVAAGRDLVIVELDEDRVEGVDHPVVMGDATDDAVLRAAGIERAAALVAAVDGDAANSFITLSARALQPNLFIVARARSHDSEEKLRRAGADRVVNPQSIGGARMAAFVLRPNVAEFLDVVMHEQSLEFRLEEVPVAPDSAIAGRSLRDTQLRDRTGALVLALRDADGVFQTNPGPDAQVSAGQVIIAIGTQDELDALVRLVVT